MYAQMHIQIMDNLIFPTFLTRPRTATVKRLPTEHLGPYQLIFPVISNIQVSEDGMILQSTSLFLATF